MTAFHQRLRERSIPANFTARRKKYGMGQVGGATDGQAEAHFAMNFAGAVARPAFVYLDPHQTFARPGAVLRAVTLDGRMCLVDAPSGAGAASLGVLCLVAELRERNVLPITPLDVHIIFADVARLSLGLCVHNLADIQPRLSRVGVNVTYETTLWDVTAQADIIDLAERVESVNPPTTLILVSAFSEALREDWAANYTWLGTLLEKKGYACALVWAEPSTDSKYKGAEYLEALAQRFREYVRRFGLQAADEGASVSSCQAVDPAERGAVPFTVRVAALAFFNQMWRA